METSQQYEFIRKLRSYLKNLELMGDFKIEMKGFSANRKTYELNC